MMATQTTMEAPSKTGLYNLTDIAKQEIAELQAAKTRIMLNLSSEDPSRMRGAVLDFASLAIVTLETYFPTEEIEKQKVTLDKPYSIYALRNELKAAISITSDDLRKYAEGIIAVYAHFAFALGVHVELTRKDKKKGSLTRSSLSSTPKTTTST